MMERAFSDTHLVPMTAEPVCPLRAVRKVPGIRAVCFDVYGTLLISAAGGEPADSPERVPSLVAALRAVGMEVLVPEALPKVLADLDSAIVGEHNRCRQEGIEYPEVEIRTIWRGVLEGAVRAGILTGPVHGWCVERFCMEYEFRIHPVCPMPGAVALLDTLRRAGLRLGLISNAQFYTHSALYAALGGEVWVRELFRGPLVFSYALGEAKPGRRLFRTALTAMEGWGIGPEAVLYVGNDMLNDVWAASRVGMRTCLFAGDKRSLRLRSEDPRCAGLQPDATVCRMGEIAEILDLAEGGAVRS